MPKVPAARSLSPYVLALCGLVAAPPGAGAQSLAPNTTDCFVYAERSNRDADDFAKHTSAQVPTITVTGIQKRYIDTEPQILTRNAAGFPPSLFAGTGSNTPKNGTVVLKYLTWNLETFATGSVPTATSRTELNRIVVSRRDREQESPIGTIDFRLGLLAADVPYRISKQRRKARWRVSGLGPGTYYASFRRGTKTVSKIKLGTATGPCGYLSVRQYNRPRTGNGPWDVFVHRGPTLDRKKRHLLLTGVVSQLSSTGDFAGILERPGA